MKKNTKMLALSAMFVALIAVFAQISFPIPGTPIVFTMGIMGVMLTGLMLPWGYAFLALIVYLLLGAVGLPVFSSFGAGLGTLLGPTGGFLMVYPIMVITAAGMWRLFQPIASRKWKNGIVRVLLSEPVLSFLAAEVCMIPCYLGGSDQSRPLGPAGNGAAPCTAGGPSAAVGIGSFIKSSSHVGKRGCMKEVFLFHTASSFYP